MPACAHGLAFRAVSSRLCCYRCSVLAWDRATRPQPQPLDQCYGAAQPAQARDAGSRGQGGGKGRGAIKGQFILAKQFPLKGQNSPCVRRSPGSAKQGGSLAAMGPEHQSCHTRRAGTSPWGQPGALLSAAVRGAGGGLALRAGEPGLCPSLAPAVSPHPHAPRPQLLSSPQPAKGWQDSSAGQGSSGLLEQRPLDTSEAQPH